MKASQTMTRDVICIRSEDLLQDAVDIMKEWDIRHLPVVEQNELIGILSDRDLLPHTDAAGKIVPMQRTVGESMTRNPITANSNDTIAYLAGLMLDHKIDCIPIVKEQSRELDGLVTTTDMIEILRHKFVGESIRTLPWSYAIKTYGRQSLGYL